MPMRCCFPKRSITEMNNTRRSFEILLQTTYKSSILVSYSEKDVKGPTIANKVTIDQTATTKPFFIVAEQTEIRQNEWRSRMKGVYLQ